MFRAYFLSCLLLYTLALGAEERLPVAQIMSPQDRESTGIDKLSLDQKAAFERWAASWTHHVLDQSPSYRPGQNLSQWVQSWPGYANPTKTQLTPEELADRQRSNQVIDRVRNNGEYIDLKDGSSWHVSAVFRSTAAQWQKNQVIEVAKGRNDLHPWALHNVNLDQVVESNLATAPSPTGKKAPEPAGYYKGAVKLQGFSTQGDILSLSDGSQWKVAPTDQYKVRNWTPADRVRVEKSENFLYGYKLTNLDTGEVALAQPQK